MTTLDPEASLRALVERVLRNARPRGTVASREWTTQPTTPDTTALDPRAPDLDPGLLAPHSPDPLLVQGGGAFATLALALGLLDELARRGGTRWSRSRIDTLRRTVLARLEPSHRNHVAVELEAIVAWFADAVVADPPTSPSSTSPDAAGLDAHRALAREAIAEGADLLLEHLDRDGTVWRQLRLRPDGQRAAREETEDSDGLGERVTGRRVPEGDRVEIELEQVRWMMVVTRLGDLPPPPSLATVHAFPPRPDTESD